MCDYSLSHLQSRPATINDRLVITRFNSSCTQGFTAVGHDPDVVVCVQPGTELVFEKPVLVSRYLFGTRSTGNSLARFRQVELDNPHTHHDAVEFPDGAIVKLTRLVPGQLATVLQLPRHGVPARRTYWMAAQICGFCTPSTDLSDPIRCPPAELARSA